MNSQKKLKQCIGEGCNKHIDAKYIYCFKCNKDKIIKRDAHKANIKKCIMCNISIKDNYIKCFKCFTSKKEQEPGQDINNFIDDIDDIKKFRDINDMCRFCGWCEAFPASHVEHAGTSCKYINSVYTRDQIINMLF